MVTRVRGRSETEMRAGCEVEKGRGGRGLKAVVISPGWGGGWGGRGARWDRGPANSRRRLG